MGNQLGPVLFICVGIALGYIVITGRVNNLTSVFVANPKNGGSS